MRLGRSARRLTSRWAAAPWTLAFLHLHIHHYKGPAIDYGALAIASFASWVGVPGPGEAVLIAAAVLASKHHLGIVSVLFVAFVGAVVGGIAGWLAGLWAGRGLVTARGPLHKLRLNAVERGEQVFERYTVLAIFLTPSWVAGIHRVKPGIYNLVNVVTAVMWAGGIGLAAYAVGPSVTDEASDLGTITTVLLVAGILALVGGELLRRRRKRTHGGSG